MKIKKITRSITATITALMLSIASSINVFAAEADGWASVINWGNTFAEHLQSIGRVVAIIAAVILGIVCITGGRDWVNKLKSVGGGILIGIVIISFGTSIVAGLFA
ncbi:TrbC/VirB2 family protein [Ruminococcus sp.]|uniref:TrbC/VirB2 family protein n=1 Tax=Ruminococcus sp. TaxID=41978 RepID=UPI0025FE94E1|nr:TrbC/VirB2 family protein [Ruminococcus sp.]